MNEFCWQHSDFEKDRKQNGYNEHCRKAGKHGFFAKAGLKGALSVKENEAYHNSRHNKSKEQNYKKIKVSVNNTYLLNDVKKIIGGKRSISAAQDYEIY